MVGLTARDFSDTGRLARLATDPHGENREDIYLAVVSLYRTQSETLSGRERGLMRRPEHRAPRERRRQEQREALRSADERLYYRVFRPVVQANGEIGWKLLQGMAKMLRAAREG